MQHFGYKEMARAVILVGLDGATVTAVDGEGAALASCGFSAGIHKLAHLAPYFQGAESVRVEGADVFIQGAVMQRNRGPLHYATGANPDFVPRSQYDQSLQADLLVRKLSKQSRALDKRLNALAAAESRGIAPLVENDEAEVRHAKGDEDGKAQAGEKAKKANEPGAKGGEPEGPESIAADL